MFFPPRVEQFISHHESLLSSSKSPLTSCFYSCSSKSHIVFLRLPTSLTWKNENMRKDIFRKFPICTKAKLFSLQLEFKTLQINVAWSPDTLCVYFTIEYLIALFKEVEMYFLYRASNLGVSQKELYSLWKHDFINVQWCKIKRNHFLSSIDDSHLYSTWFFAFLHKVLLMYFVFLISFGCLSMFSHSSLNFFKTIILNSLSGSKISISVGQLLGFYFSSFGGVKFPLILCDPCGLVLVSMHLKKEHFFQSLQGKAFTSSPVKDSGWAGWWGPPVFAGLQQSPLLTSVSLPPWETCGPRGSLLALYFDGWCT